MPVNNYTAHQKEQRRTFFKRTICDAKGCSQIAAFNCPVPDLHVGHVTFHTCGAHYDRWINSRTDYILRELKAYNENKG